MKISKPTKNNERLILTAMIVNKNVLARMLPKWDSQLFRSRWANLVGSWCIDYYKKYEKAPGKHIENKYDSWSVKSSNESLVKLVDKFLSGLSEEYEANAKDINSDYIIDIAGKHFNTVRMERLMEEIEEDIEAGQEDNAKAKLEGYGYIELGQGEGINALEDMDAVREAFEEQQESLLRFPEPLNKFFREAFHRDGFIAFMGPEKRGKTFWLQECAYRGILERHKVAFFAVGDMSRNQMMRRICSRISKVPVYPAYVRMPTSIEDDGRGVHVNFKSKQFKKGLYWQQAWKAFTRLTRTRLRSKQPLLKLSCHPNSTLSVRGLESILKTWERDDWIPDIIIIDYADILDMTYKGLEGRECINQCWKELRALSQKYHCLVITATQADAASYDKKTISQSNFSEDKRKMAHITGLIGLNQTKEEKLSQIMRLNWIVLRERDFSPHHCIYVANCLALANPAVKSFEKDWKKFDKDAEDD